MLDLGFVTVDLSPILTLGEGDIFTSMWRLFAAGGWIPIVYVLLRGLWAVWVFGRQIKFDAEVTKPVLLKIDIPRENVQTPKAVENIFANLHGSFSNFTKKELYWEGKFQPIYSFEIVSTEGFVQFYVRVWDKYRDLVEAIIYAQYSQAQLTEVPPEEDYTRFGPHHFPDPEYDLFGSEMKLKKGDVLPIRTYPEFEHGTSDPEFFKDPLANLLEGLAALRKGEQVWIQLLVQTVKQDAWIEKGKKMVQKLIGAKGEHAKLHLVDHATNFTMKALETAGNVILGSGEGAGEEKKDEPRSQMLFLSPGERVQVEAIEKKISKYGFRSKIRFIYLAPVGKLRKGTILSIIRGALRQLTSHAGNEIALDGHATTKTDYFWQRRDIFYYLSLFSYHPLHHRQHSIIRRYRGRSMSRGATPSIMNTEELATVWHFPVAEVKAPLISKTTMKVGEPPSTLPTDRTFGGGARAVTSETRRESPPSELPEDGPPENLPMG